MREKEKTYCRGRTEKIDSFPRWRRKIKQSAKKTEINLIPDEKPFPSPPPFYSFRTEINPRLKEAFYGAIFFLMLVSP